MDWKKHGLNWWEKEEVVNYKKPQLHPNYAGWSPTPDVEVQWFEVIKSNDWNKFSIEYFPVGKMFVGYRTKEDDTFHLSVGTHGMDKNEIVDIEKVNPYHRCSIWLSNLEDRKNHTAIPIVSFRFYVFEGFHIDLPIKQIPDRAFIGLYSIDWYW